MPLASTARAVPTSHSDVDYPRISLINKELQARMPSSDGKGYRAKNSPHGTDSYEALDVDDEDLPIDKSSLFVFTESVRNCRHRDYLLLKVQSSTTFVSNSANADFLEEFRFCSQEGSSDARISLVSPLPVVDDTNVRLACSVCHGKAGQCT